MSTFYDLVVVLPIGPNTKPEFINDTIDSIYHYCRCNLKIIIADDSMQGLGLATKAHYPEADLLVNRKPGGMAGGLYITLSKAYRHAIERYSFHSLLKIDTDALVTGPDPQEDAKRLFESKPYIGIAGLIKNGNEIIDFNNNCFDNRWPRNYMFDVTCTWKVIKRPIANPTLRYFFRKAYRNGYEAGSNIFGGAYFMSEVLLHALANANLLPAYGLKGTRMEEDHLWGMLASIVGYEMGDMASDNLPFGVYWKRLPASPAILLQHKKKIIHSTRSWQDMDEAAIRDYFRKVRYKEQSLAS